METLLKATELAQIMGCSERYIQKLSKEGKIPSCKTVNEKNRPVLLFPLDAFSPELQRKYMAQHKVEPSIEVAAIEPETKPLDNFSADEREEIQFWLGILSEWQQYRENYRKDKAQADERYVCLCAKAHPDKIFSTDILYRKQRALRKSNFAGLLDNRGKMRKGKSSIPEIIWQAFLSFYLDENRHPVKKCLEYTKMWAQQEHPELVADIPCYTTFIRHLKTDLPEAVKTLGREGEKAFSDRCAPYIRRTYADMQSNDWWIADNHTFDIISEDEDGKYHRLYLTAFFDARAGIFTGCYVTLNPSSQATLIALRKGILKYGIPKNIYVDNGREFLTYDIGGLGHRKKKKAEAQHEPPPVFARLGIKMTNAIVKNAKAKIIERRFRDVKDQLSRLFDSYTGGNVLERPEKLKKVLKKGGITTDAELTAIVENLLENYFNEAPYGGEVAADRGKPRIQVYQENLLEKRTTSAEELALMLMRSARPQKIGRRGVHLDVNGARIDYWNDELLLNYLGQTVYFRYDPENLTEVRIYDLQDRYMMSVPTDNEAILSYNASKEQVQAAMSKTRRFNKVTKEALQSSVLPGISSKTALELVMTQAELNKQARANNPLPEPKILTLQRPAEEYAPLPMAMGGEVVPDLSRMTQNAILRNGGMENGEDL